MYFSSGTLNGITSVNVFYTSNGRMGNGYPLLAESYGLTLSTIGETLYTFGGAKGTSNDVYYFDNKKVKWVKDPRRLSQKMTGPYIVVYNAFEL